MIEKRVMLTLKADQRQLLRDVYDLKNIRNWWMFLKDIEMISEDSYIAKFRVFMSFKFSMKRTIGINRVVHEGVMKFPKASFKFTVEAYPKKSGEVDLLIKGEYSGPLERLAGTTMEVFLRNFAKNLEEKYKGRSEELKVRQILQYQLEASKDYNGEIIITINDCRIVVKGGRIIEAQCEGAKGDEAIKKVLNDEKPKIKIEYT
ncbi:hypothetical protein [Stygiolobus caldivivus]|uniref:Uncharacterized protein n=1 Tax=Stygiolobus caldivivus TaxID=2824673 RepID=A0A8D5U609_9CREN|nr:hypothetical protein [Stygiolobus caldivivus]BCU70151.1 hypothetical protein KN1_14480 [Stygiolobus caldivivus]